LEQRRVRRPQARGVTVTSGDDRQEGPPLQGLDLGLAVTASGAPSRAGPPHEFNLPRRPPCHWLRPPRDSVVNAPLPWRGGPGRRSVRGTTRRSGSIINPFRSERNRAEIGTNRPSAEVMTRRPHRRRDRTGTRTRSEPRPADGTCRGGRGVAHRARPGRCGSVGMLPAWGPGREGPIRRRHPPPRAPVDALWPASTPSGDPERGHHGPA